MGALRRFFSCGTVLLLGSLIGCGGAQGESTRPEALRPVTSLDPTRYVPDDADVIVHLDQAALRTSFYAPYVRRMWTALQASKDRFPFADVFEKCDALTFAFAMPRAEDAPPDSLILAGRGSCAEELESATHGEGKFAKGAFVIGYRRMEMVDAAARERSRPSTFDTAGAALAVRVRVSPAVRESLRAEEAAGLSEALDGLAEVRLFARVDMGLTAWLELVAGDDASAERWATKAPLALEDLKKNVVSRLLNLEQGLRVVTTQRQGRTISFALSMLAGDAETWVALVDRAAQEWVAAGGAKGVGMRIGLRATATVSFAPPERSRSSSRPVPAAPAPPGVSRQPAPASRDVADPEQLRKTAECDQMASELSLLDKFSHLPPKVSSDPFGPPSSLDSMRAAAAKKRDEYNRSCGSRSWVKPPKRVDVTPRRY